MIKLPDINDHLCEEIFNKTKLEIEGLSSKLKIDNLSKESLAKISAMFKIIPALLEEVVSSTEFRSTKL